jgi:hypothetical protein
MEENNRLGNGGDDDIFVYTGGEQEVPRDVRRVRIAESIDTIPARKQLIEVEGHDELKKIEKEAIYRCSRLRRLTKMGGVQEIQRDAFLGCRSLTDLEFDKLEIIGEGSLCYCESLRSINMPFVRRVERCAFQHCKALTEAVFGKDLEGIEGSAFNNCTALRRIAIPLKNDLIVEEDGAFNWCKNLSRIDVIGGTQETISSLHMESWRNEMEGDIESINQSLPGTLPDDKTAAIQQWIESVHPKMEYYKAEHQIVLKESMTLLELALWKANLDKNVIGVPSQEGVKATRRQVKRARKERCITSGASIIIKNVLPFLELK